MSLDAIGGLGEKKFSSKKYLHLSVDHFTRYTYFSCTKGQSAKEIIKLINSVHSQNPIGMLLTDQYGSLTSEELGSYCDSSGISHIFTTVDSAFSNGLNERLNQTIVNKIRCVKHDKSFPSRRSWPTIAEHCIYQYNSSPHSVTSFSPSYLLTGKPPDFLPSPLRDPPNLEADRKLAFEKSLQYHKYNKKRYDRSKNEVDFKVDERVFIDNGNKLNREKLDPVRIGPFKITRQLSHSIYEIYVGQGPSPLRLYHASKMLHAPDCIN